MVTLWEPLPALVYRGENDCVWRIKIGNEYFPAPQGANGHRLQLQDSYKNVECKINGSRVLDVIILVTGWYMLIILIMTHWNFIVVDDYVLHSHSS